MSDTIIAGIIGAVCTILAAVLSPIVQKSNFSFTSKKKTIHASGTGRDISITKGGKTIDSLADKWKYDFHKAAISISGKRVNVSMKYIATTSRGQLNMEFIGNGVMEDGSALLDTITKSENGSSWKGFMILHIPIQGDIHGVWMTCNVLEMGSIAIGNIVLDERRS